MNFDLNTTWLSPDVLLIEGAYADPPIDVDYVDISDTVITDPARLLPLESALPNSSNH